MAECDCNNPVDDTSHIINLGTEIHVLKSQLEDAEKRADELQIKVAQLQAENERLKNFLDDWDGHASDCGRNSEGFEGCDTTMFNCDCGYDEEKQEALKG